MERPRCADRLRSGSSARVDVSQSSMNRGEAIKKAKGEDKTYVVYLHLKLDEMVKAEPGARDEVRGVESKSEEEIRELHPLSSMGDPTKT